MGAALAAVIAAAALAALPRPAAAQAVAKASYTVAQADSGYVAYERLNCGSCHGADLSGVGGPPLKGGPFAYNWDGKFTNALINLVRMNEPSGSPGTVDEATATLLVAYILSMNGVAEGTEPLSMARRAVITITPRDR